MAKTKKPEDRKKFLKDALVKHLEEKYPETNRKFSIFDVWVAHGTRGSFRDYLKGDFKPEDRYTVADILAELKQDGVLYHVGGPSWTRLK